MNPGTTVHRTSTPEARSAKRGTAAPLLLVAGALFVAYPALRPYSSETGLDGARVFGSDRWLVAHICGMAAFVLFAAAVESITGAQWLRRTALAGVALILPYYGAEAFGLHAIGARAVEQDDPGLIALADPIRNGGAAMVLFGLGWIALAVTGAGAARALWTRGARSAAVLVGLGFVLYLAQFFGPPWVRIAHGVLLGAGLALAAVAVGRRVDVG